MGLKQSKTIKRMRKEGIFPVVLFLGKRFADQKILAPFAMLYPKLALNKNEYKTFQIAKNHFKEHYINIIAINPLFFMQNLKKHIAWIESKEFQECYGNIFTSNASTKIESSHLDSIRTQNTDNNIESKQADFLTSANNAKNSIVTPPPPIVVAT